MIKDITTDAELERALLCCCLLRPEAIPAELQPGDFWEDIHREAFEAIKAMPPGDIDIHLLKRKVVEMGADWDGSYFGRILESNATGHYLESYAQEVIQLSQRRKVLRLVHDLKQRLCDPEIEVRETVEYARAQFARDLR